MTLIKGYIIALRFGENEMPPYYINPLHDMTFIESLDLAFIFPTREVADVFAEIIYDTCNHSEYFVKHKAYPCIEYHKRKESKPR